MSLRRRRLMYWVGCLSVLTFCGCGAEGPRPVAEAKGVLKFDGNPLSGYSVFFVSKEGEIATGVTDKEGNFTLQTGDRAGAPVGECKAYIQEPRERLEITEEQMKTMDQYTLQHMKRSKPRDPALKKLNIPSKYNTPEKSELTYTVASDPTKNNFEMNLAK